MLDAMLAYLAIAQVLQTRVAVGHIPNSACRILAALQVGHAFASAMAHSWPLRALVVGVSCSGASEGRKGIHRQVPGAAAPGWHSVTHFKGSPVGGAGPFAAAH